MILHCTVLHCAVTNAYRSTVYVYPFVVIQEGIHLVESQPLEHIAERAFLYYREDQVWETPNCYIPVCLSVYLSVYLSVCMSVCISIYLSVYLSICLVDWPLMVMSVSKLVFLFFCLPAVLLSSSHEDNRLCMKYIGSHSAVLCGQKLEL